MTQEDVARALLDLERGDRVDLEIAERGTVFAYVVGVEVEEDDETGGETRTVTLRTERERTLTATTRYENPTSGLTFAGSVVMDGPDVEDPYGVQVLDVDETAQQDLSELAASGAAWPPSTVRLACDRCNDHTEHELVESEFSGGPAWRCTECLTVCEHGVGKLPTADGGQGVSGRGN